MQLLQATQSANIMACGITLACPPGPQGLGTGSGPVSQGGLLNPLPLSSIPYAVGLSQLQPQLQPASQPVSQLQLQLTPLAGGQPGVGREGLAAGQQPWHSGGWGRATPPHGQLQPQSQLLWHEGWWKEATPPQWQQQQQHAMTQESEQAQAALGGGDGSVVHVESMTQLMEAELRQQAQAAEVGG